MSGQEHHLVLKYFDLLDEFVRVRVLQDGDLQRLDPKRIKNKTEYRRAVIRACLPDFRKEIARRLAKLEEEFDPVTIEDLLYQVCIDVNPGLEIHQVSLPVEGAGGTACESAPAILETKKVLRLEKRLRSQVLGQDEAVALLTKAVKKAAVGLKRPNSPIGTFLLVGRTGTGKTEMAKVLASSLFQDPSRLVRIDCSEYALPHEYAKLIGSPPGYIGHSEGGYLTEAVKTKKACVVLFDEVEKAHSKVHNLLLQILDEGRLTDSKGETVSFTDCLIVMTSNLGIEDVERIRGRMGFDRENRSLASIDHAAITKDALKENFRPEFLNRIDEIIVFNPLDVGVCVRIVAMMLGGIAELLAARGYEVRFSNGLKRHLAEEGFSEEYGAREIRRLIKREVEDRIAETILDRGLRPGAKLFVRLRRGTVTVEVERAEKTAVEAVT